MTDNGRAVHIDGDQAVAAIPDPRVVHISERLARASGPAAPARPAPPPRPRDPGTDRLRTARRGFLRRAVGYLAADAGVRQFVDLGSRLPVGEGIGRAAAEYAPGSRVVYVHAESTAALPGGSGAGDHGAAVLAVERMDPDHLLAALSGRGLVDLAEPVGVLLTDAAAPDRDGAPVRDLVRALHAALSPGAHIAVAQPAPDTADPHRREAAAAVFAPFTLIEPGLADMAWWPYPDEEVSAEPTGVLAGVGRRD
ncbi:SAM-dependent methyltransferase [Streptomonospora sp. S1-112]|uniref:SAM-dependent methyltransferase n=1 Tax=Streptomonospora mangrovi TaxID=2883123 RepID=A0A9X3NKB9_9ACTN|nr:SAM-dependent methyltransferase [Streptomonospora mangrovi]MDA0565384.1 SAM-dependent methyltransferase [Streptomonospora mangrovi]